MLSGLEAAESLARRGAVAADVRDIDRCRMSGLLRPGSEPCRTGGRRWRSSSGVGRALLNVPSDSGEGRKGGRDRFYWCGRGDLNSHALAGAATSRLCVCQFRHFRISLLAPPHGCYFFGALCAGDCAGALGAPAGDGAGWPAGVDDWGSAGAPAGAGLVGDFGALTGAGCFALSRTVLPTDEPAVRVARIERDKDVIMKTTADTVVALDKSVAEPRGPKAV